MHKPTLLSAAALLAITPLALAQGEGGRPGGGAPQRSPEQFVQRMMENDANGDGKLSPEELRGRFAERMFESGDANADGFLDPKELGEIARNFGQGRGRPGAEGEAERPWAPIGAVPGRAGQPGEPVDSHEAFEEGMKQAGRALRQLRRSDLSAASRTQDLELVQAVQMGLISAKAHAAAFPMAPQARERFGADEKTYQAEFRMHIIQSLMEALAMEAAIVEGDTAAAKESLEHLLESQKAGHDAFQPEEDEEEAAAPAEPATPAAPGRRPGRGG